MKAGSAHIKGNYLASPPLVVAYALAGSVTKILSDEPLSINHDGNDVYLKDIWPSNEAIHEELIRSFQPKCSGHAMPMCLKAPRNGRQSTHLAVLPMIGMTGRLMFKKSTLFQGMTREIPVLASDITGARILALLGDSVTTDHISPAGGIARDTPAADFLADHQVRPVDFNSFGARRGNHEVMMRGTFANIRLKNMAAAGTTGGFARHVPSGEVASAL